MIRFLLIIILSLQTTLYIHAENNEYYNLVDKADKAIKDSDWKEAEQLILSAMRLEPGNPGNLLLMSNLGMVRFNAGEDSLALQTLDDAHAMAPASVTVLQNRAQVLMTMGRNKEAYRDLSTILSLDSIMVEPRFYHAMLSLELGNDSICTADIQILEKIAPSHRYTHLAKATHFRLTGNYHEAIYHLNKLLDKEKYPEHFAARALCEMMNGDLDEAARDIAEAIALDPTDGELYLHRAVLNKMRYRPDDSQADAKRAIELGVPPQKVQTLLK